MPEHQQMKQSKKPEPTFQKQETHVSQSPVSNPFSIIQRAEINPKSLTHADVMQLQRTIGNRAVGRLLSGIGSSSTTQHSTVQRQEMPEEEEPLQGKMAGTIQRQEPEEEELIQGKMIETIQRQEIPEKEEPLQTKRENNTGMPDNLKAGVESLSGMDMSDVRVHYNSDKPAEVGALAYTQGTNIHVAPEQEKHLPHEAWHVVQQAQGRVKSTMQTKDGIPVNDDKGLEHEADVMGGKALEMRPADRTTFTPIAQAKVLKAQGRGSKETSKVPGEAIGAFWEKGRLNQSSSKSQLVIQREKGTCAICMEENVEGVTTACCKMFVCNECSKEDYHALIKDPQGPGQPVKCAGFNCDAEIDPHVYDGILKPDVIERLDKVSKMGNEVVKVVEPSSLEIALAGGFKCPHCGIPVTYGGGCDVMVCPGCSKKFNCTGGEANVHSFDMEHFFAAVKNFSKSTAKDQFIKLAKQFPLPWTAMKFDELHSTVEDALDRGDKDAVEGLIKKIICPEWTGLKEFLGRHYISSGIDYDACRKCTTLSALIEYVKGKVSSGDLEILNALALYEEENASKLPFMKQLERNKRINQLKDENLKSIVRSKLPS